MPSFLVLLLSLAPALLLSVWFIWRQRDLIRTVVVKLMPVKQRVSPQSFHIQTRLSTIAGIALTIALTALLNWGFIRAYQLIKRPASGRTAPVETFSTAPAPLPPALTAPKDTATSPPRPRVPAAEAPLPADDRSDKGRRRPRPRSYDRRDYQIPHYLQLGAFYEADYALDLRARHARRLDLPIQIIRVPGDPAPYKVLAGPFRSRREAKQYGARQRLRGFPRPVNSLPANWDD